MGLVAEPDCQPVEQFGMRGLRAHASEVTRRIHETYAEVILPDTIHNRSPSQDVGPIGDPVRESGASRAFVFRGNREARGQPGDTRERSGSRQLAGRLDAATLQNMNS